MEKWFNPIKASALPKAEKVLILAPHPDDEIFGCGGAIGLYVQQETSVHIHVLTDGAGYAPFADRACVREKRKNESSAAITQISREISYDFGPYQDRSLMQESNLIEHIKKLLRQHRPEVVFAPSPWEIHPDHQACARAVTAAISAIQRIDESGIDLMFYEIGYPLHANFLLDISSVWSIKEKSMRCFSSQLVNQDYLRHVQGLNIYRTYNLPMHVQYAEAYHYLSADDLLSSTKIRKNSVNGNEVSSQLLLDHWTESVLQSASVHAEELQREVIKYEKSHAEMIQIQLKTLQLQEQILAREQLSREKLSAHLAILQKQLLDMHQSTSWYITKPLRVLGGWLKKIRGG